MEKIEETYITKRELEVTLDAAFKRQGKEIINEVLKLIGTKITKLQTEIRGYTLRLSYKLKEKDLN